MQAYHNDTRTIMTLDAGGTNLVFSAVQGCEEVIDPIQYPSLPNDLKACMDTIVEGFEEIMSRLSNEPVAISFAFPGPADYEEGIIGDLPNFPAFSGGVALGPMLEEKFELPVFINNDGWLFALGEAVSGFLPWVNNRLRERGIDHRYQNLIGVTLGTGLGGGIIVDGQLCRGDNTLGGSMWLLRSKSNPKMCAEEGVSIRAVQRNYARFTDSDMEVVPNPEEIFQIGISKKQGNQKAARKAFELLGEELGDVLANVATLVDAMIVIGGGLSGASELFLPSMIEEMSGKFATPDGDSVPRLAAEICNLDKENGVNDFFSRKSTEIPVPGSNRKVSYNPQNKIGIGISHLGTNRAVSVGAYHIALSTLDNKTTQKVRSYKD